MCSFRGSYANRGNETELSSRNRPAADRREIGTIDTKRPGPLCGARASWCECS